MGKGEDAQEFGNGEKFVYLLRINNIFLQKCIVYATFLLSLHHITKGHGYTL